MVKREKERKECEDSAQKKMLLQQHAFLAEKKSESGKESHSKPFLLKIHDTQWVAELLWLPSCGQGETLRTYTVERREGAALVGQWRT